MCGKVREELKDIFEAAGVDVQVTGVSSLFHTLYKERGEKWRGCDEFRQKKASRISSSSDREWSLFPTNKKLAGYVQPMARKTRKTLQRSRELC